MDQLISINSVPISIEIEISRAKLNYKSDLPKVEMSRNKGGLKIEAEPIKLQLDGTNMRNSIGMKTSDRFVRDNADRSVKIAYQAIAKIVQDGNALASPKNISPADIAANNQFRDIQTVLSFLPSEGMDVSWSGGTLNVHYEADDLNFDWDVANSAQFEFVPGTIEFMIKELPRVDIEYIGDPIYVPPSAAPGYNGEIMEVKV